MTIIMPTTRNHRLFQFRNCFILRDHQIIREDLWVRNGKIVNPEVIFFQEKIFADEHIDCNGAIISPGFIDVQINGKQNQTIVVTFLFFHPYKIIDKS